MLPTRITYITSHLKLLIHTNLWMFEETIWVMQFVETNILDQLPTELVSILHKNNGFVPMKKVIEGKNSQPSLQSCV